MTFPVKTEAIASTVVAGTSIWTKICFDPISCTISIVVTVLPFIDDFLRLLGIGDCSSDDFYKGLTDKGISKDQFEFHFSTSNENFGGKIEETQECKCKGTDDLDRVIAVGAPRPALVGLTSGTKIYQQNSFAVGNWVIGKTTGRIVCEVPLAYEASFIGTSR